MANVPESASYDSGIYQLETVDEVLGGVNGKANAQAKGLANRTSWLKAQVDALNLLKGKGVASFSIANSYVAGEIVDYQKNIYRANTTVTPGAWNASQWNKLLGTAAESELASVAPLANGAAAVGTSTLLARQDHVHPTDTTCAPLASPTFTGAPAAPTPAQFDNDTSIATTEFVQRALGNLRGMTGVTATGTLSAANVGAAINVAMGSVGQVVSLPLAASLPVGSQFTLFNQGLSYTLSRSGSDALSTDGGNSTSLAIATGAMVVATVGSAYRWLVGGPGVLSRQGDFAAYRVANGYQILPSGVIVQWGNGNVVANTDTLITFPLAFPNAKLHVQTTNHYTNGSGSVNSLTVVGVNDTSKTNFVAHSASTGGIYFMAIGY